MILLECKTRMSDLLMPCVLPLFLLCGVSTGIGKTLFYVYARHMPTPDLFVFFFNEFIIYPVLTACCIQQPSTRHATSNQLCSKTEQSACSASTHPSRCGTLRLPLSN